MSRLHLAQHSWLVSKDLVKLVGIEASILYHQLLEIQDSLSYNQMMVIDDKYYFSFTVTEIENSTTLTYVKQLRCIKTLKSHGYIDTKLKGIPATKLFTITI